MQTTLQNTSIENTAFVEYDYRSQQYQEQSNTVTFKTVPDSPEPRTPAEITLMHNSINFSAQLQAANAASGNSGFSSPISSRTINSTNSSRSFSNISSRTTASSTGAALNGAFSVQSGQCATDATGSNLIAQPTPTDYQGKPLAIPSTLSLASDEFFKVGDTIFVHIKDLDQNQNAALIEKIIVTIISDNGNDQETIQLTETNASSGLFTGFIQSVDVNAVGATAFNCELSVTNDSSMQASYQDKLDPRDLVKAGALFDPNSYVVNADTGEYVNGIEVTLIDATTDLPADILSDEGGVFPNPVITGNSYTINGTTYAFPYGGFAFPVLASGDYLIKVGGSAYHKYPIDELKLLNDINALPSGPFNLDELGSRGRKFISGITFRLDVPVENLDNNVILTKTSNKATAGIGELIQLTQST